MTTDVLGSENYPEWDLTDLYASDSDPALARDWALSKSESLAFETRFKGLFLTNSWNASDLLEAIQTYETLIERMGRIGTYVGLRYYKNVKDQDILICYQSAQEQLNDIQSHFIFLNLEINEISDQALESAYAVNSHLARYRPFINQIRLMKPYQKSAEVEKVLVDKSLTSSKALIRLYDEIQANMVFYIEEKPLSLSHVTELMSDKDQTTRRKAAIALSEGLQNKSSLFSFVTNTLAKDKELEDRIRGFKTPMDERHLANQVEPEVVEALVAAVKTHYPKLSHRYYQLKAKMLGFPSLQYWDRNAPLPHVDDTNYTWLESKKIVMDAYEAFSPKMAEIANDFFEKNWIDVPSTDGKTSGAFSHPAVPSVHPYILLNFHGKKRDIMTLAHELGHGVHQVLSAEQGYLLSDTPLTLAETASVFGEMLTFQSLLKKANHPYERQALLAGKIDDMLNTVVRQIAFYLFEVAIHEKRRNGELKLEEINAIWLETQADALGPYVHLDPLVGNYWAYISHFIHSPFYVYAYAFGDCLVNSLYKTFQDNPNGFQDKYIDMLKAGGSKGHKDLLAPFGLDASNPDFWSKGLAMIEELIDELEKSLANE